MRNKIGARWGISGSVVALSFTHQLLLALIVLILVAAAMVSGRWLLSGDGSRVDRLNGLLRGCRLPFAPSDPDRFTDVPVNGAAPERPMTRSSGPTQESPRA